MRSRISIRGCVRRSVRRSVHWSICLSVHPFVPNELKSRKRAILSKVRVKDDKENECMTNQATVKSAGTIISASTSTNTSKIPVEVPARQRTHLWSKLCSTCSILNNLELKVLHFKENRCAINSFSWSSGLNNPELKTKQGRKPKVACSMTDWLTDWLTDCLKNFLALDWLIDWLTDWHLTDWLTLDWLILDCQILDWLILDWLTLDWLTLDWLTLD